jgi:hypothetical protein
VHGDDGVDVGKESVQQRGVGWVYLMRWDVPLEIGRLVNAVIGGARLFGCGARNDISLLLEAAAMKCHETKRAAQLRNFFNIWVRE